MKEGYIYIFKQIDGGQSIPIDTDSWSSGQVNPVDDSFVQSNDHSQKTALQKWKNFPMQEDIIRRKHERLGWKKNATVKKTIYTEGLKRKLWNDDGV